MKKKLWFPLITKVGIFRTPSWHSSYTWLDHKYKRWLVLRFGYFGIDFIIEWFRIKLERRI
jgi:hypothetical protein